MLPMAPQPTMEIFICPMLRLLSARVETPGNVGQAFPFRLSDAIGVLGVKTHLAVLIHDLRMKTEDHILLELDLAAGAYGRMFDHGHADGMAGQVAQPKPAALKNVGGSTMNVAGQFPFAHQGARGLHGLRINLAHCEGPRTDAT